MINLQIMGIFPKLNNAIVTKICCNLGVRIFDTGSIKLRCILYVCWVFAPSDGDVITVDNFPIAF